MDNRQENKHGQDFTLGVALSGGGARGFAHAGALKAIEEAGLRIDYIAGVSAGSVVAALYSAGLRPESILNMFIGPKFFDLVDLTLGRGGFIRLDKFSDYLRHVLGSKKRLEQLHIPTYIGVTNLDKGVAEAFHTGEIVPIVTASCSIPVVIVPQVIDGTTYVDGGVLRNLPSWTLRDKCDKLIGINVSPLEPMTGSAASMMSIALRSYSLLAKSNVEVDADMCDLCVTMHEVSEHKVFGLKAITDVYECGYNRMHKQLIEAGLWLK